MKMEKRLIENYFCTFLVIQTSGNIYCETHQYMKYTHETNTKYVNHGILCETCIYKNTLMLVINFSETGPLMRKSWLTGKDPDAGKD